MTKVATLAKPAATPTKLRVSAAGNAAVESIGVKSPLNRMPSPDIRGGTTRHNVSEVEETVSLTVLMTIVLGILTSALVGAIITLILSR